jgi:hypothetical protein
LLVERAVTRYNFAQCSLAIAIWSRKMTTIDLRGIDELIRKLEQFRRLATDPVIAPFVRTNGDALPKGATAIVTIGDASTHTTSLKQAVLSASMEISGEFVVKDIHHQLLLHGYRYDNTNPMKAIGQVLRTLAREGKIRVAAPGSGRRAVKYAKKSA